MTRTQRLGNRIICGLLVVVLFGTPLLVTGLTLPAVVTTVVVAAWMLS